MLASISFLIAMAVQADLWGKYAVSDQGRDPVSRGT